MSAAPMPDNVAPTVAEWAAVILGPVGPWSLLAIDPDGRRATLWADTTSDIGRIAQVSTGDRWVGMARRRSTLRAGRGTAADCAQICALWVDIDAAGPTHKTDRALPPDIDACMELVRAMPLPATSVVATGGGIQAHWALAEPLDAVEAAAALLERWGAWWTETAARRGWHVDSVWDITRVMRLPGTRNHKHDPPRPVEHLEWRPNARWGVDDIDQWLPDELPASRPAHLAPVAGYIGPDRPGDHFSAAHTCGEILERHGWTLHHRDARTGDEHWTRPGKQRRQGASATVYAADGRCVIWTDQAPGLAARESLSPFRLLAKLEHHGNFGDAARALAGAGYGSSSAPITLDALGPTPEPVDDDSDMPDPTMGVLIDWERFWAADHVDEEWLADPVIPARRSVSIYAPGGTGKSLLALHIAASLACGRSCLGRPERPPVHVLYLDYEMTPDDLSERLQAMGYGPNVDMSHLHYALLPSLSPLDTDAGGAQVHRIAQAVAAELVVVDTYARAVEGDENEADTVRAFYRHTGSRIKAAGIALVRVDHTGKDPEKGARGSSAKRDDVDVAWRLEPLDGGPRLRAEKRRMAWVPELVHLVMDDTADLTYRVRPGTEGWPADMRLVLADMKAAGIDLEANPKLSIRAVDEAMRVKGRGHRRQSVSAAVKFLRQGGVSDAFNLDPGGRKVDPEVDPEGVAETGPESGSGVDPEWIPTQQNRWSEAGSTPGSTGIHPSLPSGSRIPPPKGGSRDQADSDPVAGEAGRDPIGEMWPVSEGDTE